MPFMHMCEFCHTEYKSRPQVKRPRACTSCQRQRQRTNEKDWRNRNPRYSDPAYHKVCREQRFKKLNEVVTILSSCLKVGKTFLGLDIAMDLVSGALGEFLFALGIRRVNKFLIEGKVN